MPPAYADEITRERRLLLADLEADPRDVYPANREPTFVTPPPAPGSGGWARTTSSSPARTTSSASRRMKLRSSPRRRRRRRRRRGGRGGGGGGGPRAPRGRRRTVARRWASSASCCRRLRACSPALPSSSCSARRRTASSTSRGTWRTRPSRSRCTERCRPSRSPPSSRAPTPRRRALVGPVAVVLLHGACVLLLALQLPMDAALSIGRAERGGDPRAPLQRRRRRGGVHARQPHVDGLEESSNAFASRRAARPVEDASSCGRRARFSRGSSTRSAPLPLVTLPPAKSTTSPPMRRPPL